jgi:3-oxoacyl-(acyl-carrier-protein) synthase
VTNNRDDEQRIVVTGMGVVTPLGEEPAEFYESLVRGRSAITRWKNLDDSRIYSKVGGDLLDFDIKAHLQKYGKDYPRELAARAVQLLRGIPVSAHLVAGAALRAYHSAGFPDGVSPERMGHILGGQGLNVRYAIENYVAFDEEPEFTDPLYSARCMDTQVLGVNSDILGLRGPALTVAAACASGNAAVVTALDLLRSGRAEVMLVTSTGPTPYQMGLQSLSLLGALSVESFNEQPSQASRPFDTRREGFVVGMGAGAVILETLAGARRRGAPILAEVLGGASSADASSLTRPHVEGQVRAMRGALEDAGLNPEEIEYVNAHATSTPLGDAVEVTAIKTVLGEHAYDIPVNATKSMTGHCLEGIGVIELVAIIMQMQNGVLHPTINLDEPDPELDLDFVPNHAREYSFNIALSNGFGFGGLNTTIIIGRAP